MMTNEQAKVIMFEEGRRQALALQDRSYGMTNDELNMESNLIPAFQYAIITKNMLERPIGFVCQTSAGRLVKLLQPYDSDIFTQEPEELVAQWGFVWSTKPEFAKPFISLATSPYMKNDCCIENDIVYRSLLDNNTWAPSDYPAGWEQVI